ncbi:MAG: type II toxin-antitoxin system RelE/ParE family toxin [Acidobacteriia bacterium]|nr:type II toxin-antitoxin system RelE/ParE family toxin [Terriglobia bacterium]
MNYRVLIDARAAKQLESLPKEIVQRVDKAILGLASSPRPPGSKRLRGKIEEGWRIRVGAYRILYRIDDGVHEVKIFAIGHRREIYR